MAAGKLRDFHGRDSYGPIFGGFGRAKRAHPLLGGVYGRDPYGPISGGFGRAKRAHPLLGGFYGPRFVQPQFYGGLGEPSEPTEFQGFWASGASPHLVGGFHGCGPCGPICTVFGAPAFLRPGFWGFRPAFWNGRLGFGPFWVGAIGARPFWGVSGPCPAADRVFRRFAAVFVPWPGFFASRCCFGWRAFRFWPYWRAPAFVSLRF